MNRDDDDSEGRVVDVRVRRVLDSGGVERQRDATVFCIEKQRTLGLDECMACERCSGLRFESVQHRAQITCGGPPRAELSTALPSEFRAGASDAPVHTPISALMGTEVLCIRADLPLESLTAMLSDSPMAAVPVVDADGVPIGIVSRTDLFRRLAEDGDTREVSNVPTRADGAVEPGLHEHRWAELSAGDFMTPVVLTLPESASVAQASAFMSFEGIHQIPVVSEHGKVVGMLSSLDVLRWLAHRSGYLVPLRPTTAR
jgi:CBS domain-containing protein